MPYKPEFLAAYGRTVSTARLFRYLAATDQNLELALNLYEKNVLLSQAVFGFLHGLEVAVRNSMHYSLSRDLSRINWIQHNLPLPWPFPAPSHLVLTQSMSDMLTEARRKVGERAHVGKLIADLGFGFWPALIASRYEHIWRNSLHTAFPYSNTTRAVVHWRLESIRHLRNRIAHHERIITSSNTVCTGRDEERQISLNALVECVSWICPETAQWLQATTHIGQADQILRDVAAMGVLL